MKKTKLNQVTSEKISLSPFKNKLPAVTMVTVEHFDCLYYEQQSKIFSFLGKAKERSSKTMD